ncbi:hypothetical protein C8Q78DRAFT_189037 [Trametes maxima]|nr:hypothetical protein C8Q78DRAFT_189037 [Trametes maxima]
MNRESSARDATHVEQTLPPGPNEEVAALSSKQKSPPSSARYGCVNVVASRADSPCLSSEPLDFNLPPSESLVGSKVSHTSSVRNPDSTEHVLPGTFMSAAVARAMINAEADRLFASHDLDAAIQAFRILPARYHDRLVDALVSSAVELDARGASIVSRLFQRGEIFEICGADALQAGFAPCAGALDELIVDFPDAKRIFFTIYDAAGLSCCEETSAGVQ